MQADEEYAEAEPERTPPPIPAFFAPDDLPEWLRPPSAPVPSVRHESARARQAWGLPDENTAPAETADFEVAAATVLARLVPSPRPPKKRRGLFGLGAALALLAGAA